MRNEGREITNDSQAVLQVEIRELANSYKNWGELLAPAPVAISILGQLILMSNQVFDFSIDNPPPARSFQHIKYPHSFRATLLQISHSGYMAFRKAHNNMNEIRIQNEAAPSLIKDAVRYLLSKNQIVMELRLPSALASIKEVADRSKALAQEVKDTFLVVLELIDETFMAVTITKSGTEISIDDLNLKLYLTDMEKQFSDQETALLLDKLTMLNATYDRLTNRQQNIMVRTLYGDEDFTINLSKDRLSQTGGRHLKHSDAFFSRSWSWRYWFHDESVETNICAEQNSQPLMELLVAFGVYRVGYEKWQTSENQFRPQFDESDTVSKIERLVGSLHKCTDIERIAEKSANLIKLLKNVNFASVKKTDPRPATAEIEEIILLVKDVRAGAKVTEKSKSNSTVYSGRNLMEVWSEVYQHQYKMIEEMANVTKEIIALNNKQMELRREKTKVILEKMASLDEKKVHYKQVLQVLVTGLEELGKLKRDWDKLLRFFGNVRVFVESASQHSLALIEIVRVVSKDPELLKEDKLFEDLLNNIEGSNEAVFLVHSIADMYVKVSDTYIMERVASLDTLNAMANRGVSGEKLKEEQAKLANSADEAFLGIANYVREDEAKLLEKLEERHKEISTDYNWVSDCRYSTEPQYHPINSLAYNWQDFYFYLFYCDLYINLFTVLFSNAGFKSRAGSAEKCWTFPTRKRKSRIWENQLTSTCGNHTEETINFGTWMRRTLSVLWLRVSA